MTNRDYSSMITDDLLRELSVKNDPFGDAVAQSIFDFMGIKPSSEVTPEEDEAQRKRYGAYMKRLATYDYFQEPESTSQMMPLLSPLYSYYFDPEFPDTERDISVFSGIPDLSILDLQRDNYRAISDNVELLNRASTFFEKNGPAIIMVLACRSLLKQYASGHTSELLGRTRLLVDFPHRRIIETMQFVMDVMKPEWDKQDPSNFEGPDGVASLQTVKKLRITHAMIRRRVALGRQAYLDGANKDKNLPINQQEMIMANLTFSLEVIEGLRALGIEVSQQEQDDFYQAWLFIGDLLGIEYPDDLRPQSYEEAWILQNKLYDFNFKKNEFGPLLAHALLNWLEDILPMTDQAAILELILEINEDGTGNNKKILEEILEIDFDCEPSNTDGLSTLIRKLRSTSKTAKRTFFQQLFHELLNKLLGLERGGKDRRFSIIAGFERSWELTPEARYKPISNWKMLWVMIKALFSVLFKRLLGRK